VRGMTDLQEPSAAEVLKHRDGRLRVAISNAVVRLWKEHYGRGPTSARTIIDDNLVFVVLQDGLTRSEETLLAAGQAQAVRDIRGAFMDAMRDRFDAALAEITGQRVLAHEGQMVFDPTMTVEIFVLDGPIQ
jgi:uncharacterized protein YbcI